MGNKGIRTVGPSVRSLGRPSRSISRRLLDSVFSNFTHVFYDHWTCVIVSFDRKQLKMTDSRPFLLLAMHFHYRRLNMVEMPVYIASIMYMQALLWATTVGQNKMVNYVQPCSAVVSSCDQPWPAMVNHGQTVSGMVSDK